MRDTKSRGRECLTSGWYSSGTPLALGRARIHTATSPAMAAKKSPAKAAKPATAKPKKALSKVKKPKAKPKKAAAKPKAAGRPKATKKK